MGTERGQDIIVGSKDIYTCACVCACVLVYIDAFVDERGGSGVVCVCLFVGGRVFVI